MTMRERVARAIAKRCDITPFDRLWAADQRHYLETADDVLAAMLVPDRAMIEAGAVGAQAMGDKFFVVTSAYAAMIDAAAQGIVTEGEDANAASVAAGD